MSQEKISYLEMIQQIISRMGSNSFSLKQWAIGVLIAVYSFAGKNENKAVIITLIPLIIFWFLDSYYLLQERKFRKLYDEARLKEDSSIDFDMNYDNIKINMKEIKKYGMIKTLFSNTIFPFYFSLIITTLIIYFVKF